MQVLDITSYYQFQDPEPIAAVVRELRRQQYSRAIMFTATMTETDQIFCTIYDGEYTINSEFDPGFLASLWNGEKYIAIQIMKTLLETRDSGGCEQHPIEDQVFDYRAGYMRCMSCGKVLRG